METIFYIWSLLLISVSLSSSLLSFSPRDACAGKLTRYYSNWLRRLFAIDLRDDFVLPILWYITSNGRAFTFDAEQMTQQNNEMDQAISVYLSGFKILKINNTY